MKKKNNMKKNVNEAYPYRKPLNNNGGKKWCRTYNMRK